MSLLPYLINNILEDQYTPYRYRPVSSLSACPAFEITPELSRLSQVLQNLENQAERSIGNVTNQDGLFKVNVDIQQFKPEEVNVKVVDDYLVIEAKHEERQDRHGFVSRQFTRRYKLPQETNLDAVKSSISSDGVLTIVAPTKVKSVEGTVRQIPITFTNQRAIKKSQPEQAEKTADNATEKK